MSKIKIIRSWWGNDKDKFLEIPNVPLFIHEVVYVWGKDNYKILSKRGYTCYLMEDDEFDNDTVYGKKLQVLDKALKHWREVLMLDWDCHILKPLDSKFDAMLRLKETQVPLYIHHKKPKEKLLEAIPKDHPSNIKLISKFLDLVELEIPKYNWPWDEGLVIPNFGCVYSSNINLGSDLIKIAKDNNIKGLVEEFAMWKYANCSMEEYIEKFLPNYVLGVSNQKLEYTNHTICKLQRKFNEYITNKINYKPYLEHV